MNERTSDSYNPLAIESGIYAMWEEEGAFRSTPDARTPYCIVIPPPNVTGALHMGHALNNSIQDVLVRYHRQKGFNVLWLPGTDHAGVATQSVVERAIWEEKRQTRYDLGRTALLDLVWKWKEKYGGKIIEQLKALGCSCDWERTRFTMDEGLSKAVRVVFVKLFHEGLIYRGKRLINWCTYHRTALSNDELVYEDSKGYFWYIRYPLASDPAEGITVATTRPETMLGDTAVAVHPADSRYAGLIGKEVILPLLRRKIPVIGDPILADPKKGTGAVKVTPAHDPYDYECGRRHGLPFINILNEDGTLAEETGPFRGMSIAQAREAVVEALRTEGLLLKVEEHTYPLAHCYRCMTVIEPFLSDQWFVSMAPLVTLARECAQRGEVRFFPESRVKQFLDWLDTTPDWCISRQIWWGHRIPVWYCRRCSPEIKLDPFGEPLAIPTEATPLVPAAAAPMDDPQACPTCGGTQLVRDPDVLDTWFSSQLWPISTLGWPQETPDLDYYYPTDVLVTARDIIALWVARMIMMGKQFMGKAPFRHVYVHGTILDEKGDIMSKSRGNGVDPLMLIEGGTDQVGGRKERYKPYGADALRYGILSMATAGQDIRLVVRRTQAGPEGVFDVEVPKMEEGRRFCNKIWQVSRGVIFPQCADLKRPVGPLSRTEDLWLSHKLSLGIEKVTSHLEAYEIGEACLEIYHLFWDHFCSWYVEIVKPRLWKGERESRADAQALLVEALSALLRLLHPLMPFITEKLWSDLVPLRRQAGMKDLGKRIIVAPWPDAGDFERNEKAFEICNLAWQVAAAVNSIKAQHREIKEVKLPLVIVTGGEGNEEILNGIASMEEGLARFIGAQRMQIEANVPPPRGSAGAGAGSVEVFVPLEGLINFEAEIARLKKKVSQAVAQLEAVRQKLKNPAFLSKADPEVVRKETEKESRLSAEIEKLMESLQAIENYKLL